MFALRTIILLSTFLFTLELSASSKIEEILFKEAKKIKILLQGSIHEAKTQAGWLWFEPEVQGFLKEIIKTGNQLNLNDPSSFFETSIQPRLNKNTSPSDVLSSKYFKPLLILKTDVLNLNPEQKYLLIQRKPGSFASVYFQTKGFQIPLGYPHSPDTGLLDLIDTHYNLVSKKISVPQLNNETSVFLLRTPYAEKITSSGFHVLSDKIEKFHQSEFRPEINYHLSNWYDFKILQFTKKYFDFLLLSMGQEKIFDNPEILNILRLVMSFSSELSHAHSRWESILGFSPSVQIEQK